MAPFPDYYDFFHLPNGPESTPDEIKKAYRKVALQMHPDENRHPDATAQFQAIGM